MTALWRLDKLNLTMLMSSFISLVFCYSKRGFSDFNNMTRLIRTPLSVVFPVSVYLRGLNVIINFIYLIHCFFFFFFHYSLLCLIILLFFYPRFFTGTHVRTVRTGSYCCNFSLYPRGLKKLGFNCTVTLCISLERYVASLQVWLIQGLDNSFVRNM